MVINYPVKFTVLFLCLFVFPILDSFAQQQAPKLLHAKTYKQNIKINDYWVSEKLDGVRAYWNGRVLISRAGNVFNAPSWFTRALPNEALDGELWISRGSFDELSGIVRKKHSTAAILSLFS